MLQEETSKDVNYPQYHHDTTQHCCTGCANTSLAWVPLSCTAEGAKWESLKAEEHTGKRVKSHPISICMWCRFGNRWGERSLHRSSPFQPSTASAAGCPQAPVHCGDVSAGSNGPSYALHCLTQKQMFSVSEAVATPTAAKGQDSHRKGSKANQREISSELPNTEQFPCIQSQLLRIFHDFWAYLIFWAWIFQSNLRPQVCQD